MALLRVVELAHPGGRGVDDLAALAASGRSPSELRRRVARLFGEPVREPLHLTRSGLAMLLVLGAALVFGPTAWTSRAHAPAEAADNNQAADEPAVEADTFTSAAVKPVTGSENVTVNWIGDVEVGSEPACATVTVGRTASTSRTSPAV